MNSQTDIQSRIEQEVTSGRGYDRKNKERTPERILNSEIGLQIALFNMETCDGRKRSDEVLEFTPRLKLMMKNFDDAYIPLEVITDAYGFKRAFDSAYVQIEKLYERIRSRKDEIPHSKFF